NLHAGVPEGRAHGQVPDGRGSAQRSTAIVKGLTGAIPLRDPPKYVERPPDPELLDERAVALDVVAAQVVQQPAPLADQEEESAAGMMVLLVDLEVLG